MRKALVLAVPLFDDDWVKKVLETLPTAIRHELIGQDLVLTASTPELQAFLTTHATTADAFGKTIELKPIK